MPIATLAGGDRWPVMHTLCCWFARKALIHWTSHACHQWCQNQLICTQDNCVVHNQTLFGSACTKYILSILACGWSRISPQLSRTFRSWRSALEDAKLFLTKRLLIFMWAVMWSHLPLCWCACLSMCHSLSWSSWNPYTWGCACIPCLLPWLKAFRVQYW